MPLARIRAQACAGEPLALHVNHQPLPEGLNVSALNVQVVDGVPQFVLAVSGEGVIEGEGIVVVRVPSEYDFETDLRQWVSRIDPEELNRKAIEHMDGLCSSPGEGFLAAMMDLAGAEMVA